MLEVSVFSGVRKSHFDPGVSAPRQEGRPVMIPARGFCGWQCLTPPILSVLHCFWFLCVL